MLTPTRKIEATVARWKERVAEQIRAAKDRRGRSRVDALARYAADPSRILADAGMPPDPWQTEFLQSARATKLILLLMARQTGKTTACGALALAEATTTPDYTAVVIAPIEKQAKEFIRKMMDLFNRIGRPIGVKREAVCEVEFANRSRVIALPGKERSVHGYTANLLVIDEGARVPDEVFNAASPQISASKGRFVGLSTAFAKSGWFWEEWNNGKGYYKKKVSAYESSRHTRESLHEERRRMGPRWFAMSYLNEFGDSLDSVFRQEDIDAMLIGNEKVMPLFTPVESAYFDPDVEPLFGAIP